MGVKPDIPGFAGAFLAECAAQSLARLVRERGLASVPEPEEVLSIAKSMPADELARLGKTILLWLMAEAHPDWSSDREAEYLTYKNFEIADELHYLFRRQENS